MSIFDSFLSILAPHECLGCCAEGSLLCDKCSQILVNVPERCYRCRKVSPGWLTCAACRKQSKLRRVSVATVYSGVAKNIVWKLKFAGAQAAAKQLATRMALLIEPESTMLIVPVPTATSRIRRRGYDQATLLAKELATITGLKYVSCLARVNQAHQVGASRSLRLKQLANAFRVTKQELLVGANILLIDDVITTGATLEAAAICLRAAGAHKIDALVFAQP